MRPLVFLPGAGGRASFWQPVANRLTDLGPAHLLGYPGFGDVPADSGRHVARRAVRLVRGATPGGGEPRRRPVDGGVLATRLAIERPERVARLVLVATSGGVDVGRLGGAEWRASYRAALPDVPSWFEDDRTDLSDRLAEIRAATLLLWSDVDPH